MGRSRLATPSRPWMRTGAIWRRWTDTHSQETFLHDLWMEATYMDERRLGVVGVCWDETNLHLSVLCLGVEDEMTLGSTAWDTPQCTHLDC
jgi:hypothetical protein